MSLAGDLCQSCGLCCDGALFSAAALERGEVTDPMRHRLRIVTRADGVQLLEQPCAALEARHCGIYEDRPQACRAFVCDLLAALESDEVSLEDAHGIVRSAQAAIADLEKRLPSPVGAEVKLHSRLRARALIEGAPDDADIGALARSLAKVEELLTHSFRGRRGR